MRVATTADPDASAVPAEIVDTRAKVLKAALQADLPPGDQSHFSGGPLAGDLVADRVSDGYLKAGDHSRPGSSQVDNVAAVRPR